MGDIFYKALVAGAVAAILGLVEIAFTKIRCPKASNSQKRGGFLKTYYTKEDAPIKFHKFNHYFFLPFRFLVLAISISDFIANFQSYDTLGVFSVLVLTVMPCALIVIAFVGFFKWAPYSLYALFAYFALDILSGVYVLVSYLRYLPEENASSIGRFCGTAVVAIFICFYYWKRRNLFLHKTEPLATANALPHEEGIEPTNVVVPPTPKEESPKSELMEIDCSIKFCRKCGKKLLPESLFCSYCGAKVKEDNYD